MLQTCQMPINVLDPSYNSFIKKVLPTLTKRKVGVLAMKALSNGRFFTKPDPVDGRPDEPLIPTRITTAEALHFVWSLPVSVLISGADNTKQLQQNIETARSFTKLNDQQREHLVDKVADLSHKRVEYYKA